MEWPQGSATTGQIIRVDSALTGWTQGHTEYPLAFSPMTARTGGWGTDNTVDSIACMWADFGTTDVEIGFLIQPTWSGTDHLEASALLGVVPGDAGFGFGFWPSGAITEGGSDVILPATIGNPPSGFEVVGSAMPYTQPETTAWYMTQKVGDQVTVWLGGVNEGTRTIPEPYASSTLHGFTVDHHLLPGSTAASILSTMWIRRLS